MLRGSLDGRGVWGRMDTCVCMAESFSCPLETITTLLISYTPIQNKKLKKLNNYKKLWRFRVLPINFRGYRLELLLIEIYAVDNMIFGREVPVT